MVVFDAASLGYIVDELLPVDDVLLQAFALRSPVFVVDHRPFEGERSQTDQGLDQVQFTSLAISDSVHSGYCPQADTFA